MNKQMPPSLTAEWYWWVDVCRMRREATMRSVSDEGAAGNAFGIKEVVGDLAMRCAVMNEVEAGDATAQSSDARDCL
jgi:hypothetical protein